MSGLPPSPSVGEVVVRRGTLSLARRLEFGAFATLPVVATAFYFWWGFRTGAWLDNGVYAVVAVLVAFGLSGMWLVLPDRVTPAPPTSQP